MPGLVFYPGTSRFGADVFCEHVGGAIVPCADQADARRRWEQHAALNAYMAAYDDARRHDRPAPPLPEAVIATFPAHLLGRVEDTRKP